MDQLWPCKDPVHFSHWNGEQKWLKVISRPYRRIQPTKSTNHNVYIKWEIWKTQNYIILSIRYYNPDWIQLGCTKGHIISPLVQRFLCLCEIWCLKEVSERSGRGVTLIVCARTLENLFLTPLKSTCRQRKVCLVNTCNEGLLLG